MISIDLTHPQLFVFKIWGKMKLHLKGQSIVGLFSYCFTAIGTFMQSTNITESEWQDSMSSLDLGTFLAMQSNEYSVYVFSPWHS